MGKKKIQKTRCTEMLFAGFGGQGIMFMGKLMTQAGLLAGKHVTWMPSYGAEVRGGTAYSMTKVSDAEIASPIVTEPDILVVMNQPSLLKYEGAVKSGGIIILNRSLITDTVNRKDVRVVKVPMTEIALKLGNGRYANMVALGALLNKSKLFPMRTLVSALVTMMKGKENLVMMNKKALEKGFKVSS